MNKEQFTVNRDYTDSDSVIYEIFSITRKCTIFVTDELRTYDAAWKQIELFNKHQCWPVLSAELNNLTPLDVTFGEAI